METQKIGLSSNEKTKKETGARTAGDSSCCVPAEGTSVCCSPAEKPGNSEQCCEQPEDGSACCVK